MTIYEESLNEYQTLKNKYGDLAGMYCHIDNMFFVENKRQSEVCQFLKAMIVANIVEDYMDLKGYQRNTDGEWQHS